MPESIPTCREFPPERILIFRRTFQISSVLVYIFWILSSGIVGFVSFYFGLLYEILVILGGILFIIILNLLYQWQYYKNYYYDLGKDTLLVNTWGIYGKKIEIPYEKIEKVSLYADSVDFFFGIYNLRIERSCVGSGSDYETCFDVYIKGLSKENAEKLMKKILENVGERK